MKTAVNIAFGAAVSLAVLLGLWSLFGAFGLAFGMPILVVFAYPLVDIVAGAPRLLFRLALRKVDGRHFAYRSKALDIDIDEHADCWISIADVRKLVPALPVEAVLLRLYPGQVKESGDPRQWRISVDALRQFLAKSTDPGTTRFATWLYNDVSKPARNRLERGMTRAR